MSTSTSTSTKPTNLAGVSIEELQAALEAARAKTNDEKVAVIAPLIEAILPVVTFNKSQNGKPWYGAALTTPAFTTEDGRKIRVSMTITDVDETDRLKKAVVKA